MQKDVQQVCSLLKQADNVVIVSHARPDGDTLGSAFALLFALEKLGKTARVECSDPFPPRYDIIFGDYTPKAFEPEFVVTVDAASASLLGDLEQVYGDKIDLCIDHHLLTNMPAKYHLVDATAPATAQLIADVIGGLGVEVDKAIANAIFSGLATDTGCFKYENVTPKTHRCAADMIEAGAEHGRINKIMFDSMSRGRLEVDRYVSETIEYHFDGACAVITVPNWLPQKYEVSEEEMDGISAKPRRIEGVKAGITLRERHDGGYRVSVRSGDGVDASNICAALGGGGHLNAAGCTVNGTLDSVKQHILDEVAKELERIKQA